MVYNSLETRKCEKDVEGALEELYTSSKQAPIYANNNSHSGKAPSTTAISTPWCYIRGGEETLSLVNHNTEQNIFSFADSFSLSLSFFSRLTVICGCVRLWMFEYVCIKEQIKIRIWASVTTL